nr:ribonuclease H-like domain-containing protein [Tanacetum cinerariifolium]
MESLSPQVVAAAKLPILNLNEFNLWKMRLEQYFLMTDYSLWEVILNGDSPSPIRVVDGVVQAVAPTAAKQRLAKKNELKARETKKVQKTLLKQQYKNFNGSSFEILDQIHDRLQKLINQLEIHGESLFQEDINLNLKIYEAEVKNSSSTSPTTQNIAFVSSQNTDSTNESVSVVASVSAASTKVLVSARPNVDNLKEMDLKWQMAMLTMRAKRSPKDTRNKDTQRRNVPVETYTSNALVSQCLDSKVAPCSKACSKAYATLPSHYDNLTNDLRKSRFDVLSYKTSLEYVEARFVIYQQNENVFEKDIKLLKLDVMLRDNTLVKLRKKFKKAEQERDELKLKLEKIQTSLKNLSKLLASQITNKTGLGYDNQVFNSTVFDSDELISFESDVSMPTSLVHDRYKSGEGYHAVPHPHTGTFMPLKPDLVFHDAPTISETVLTVINVEPSTTKSNKDLS